MAQKGTNGSGDERGIKVVEVFFEQNEWTFLREKSRLVVIFLSDEDDSSED